MLYKTGAITEGVAAILGKPMLQLTKSWLLVLFKSYLSHTVKMCLMLSIDTTGKATVLIKPKSQVTIWRGLFGKWTLWCAKFEARRLAGAISTAAFIVSFDFLEVFTI